MPQLIPFFFVSQLFVTYFFFITIVYILSKYILPLNLLTQVIRTYITKLTNNN